MQRTCFKCKIAGLPHDPNLRKCSSYTCGKFYHLACLKSLPLARTDGERIFCPLHFCKACWVNGRHQQPVRCSRCPNAYHTKCLPPSCVSIGHLLLGSRRPAPSTALRVLCDCVQQRCEEADAPPGHLPGVRDEVWH
jgi:hypothetical protein